MTPWKFKLLEPIKVDIHNTKNRVDIYHVYVGAVATATLSDYNQWEPSGARQVRVVHRNFMVEITEQVQQRFKQITREDYGHFDFSVPSNAVKCHPASLAGLYKLFSLWMM